MTVKDLAAYLGVPRRDVYLLVAYRVSIGFPVKKVARMWLVDLTQVENWMIKCEEAGIKPLELAKRERSLLRKANPRNRKTSIAADHPSKRGRERQR
jgi:hypothetical protein